jgi:hypothetical protein
VSYDGAHYRLRAAEPVVLGNRDGQAEHAHVTEAGAPAAMSREAAAPEPVDGRRNYGAGQERPSGTSGEFGFLRSALHAHVPCLRC